MRLLELESQYVFLDKLKLLEKGYLICYFPKMNKKDKVDYIRKVFLSPQEVSKYEKILCAPDRDKNYITDFVRFLKKRNLYNEIVYSPDPFEYIYDNNLFEKKSNNILGYHNDYFLQRGNKKIDKCCVLI